MVIDCSSLDSSVAQSLLADSPLLLVPFHSELRSVVAVLHESYRTVHTAGISRLGVFDQGRRRMCGLVAPKRIEEKLCGSLFTRHGTIN